MWAPPVVLSCVGVVGVCGVRAHICRCARSCGRLRPEEDTSFSSSSSSSMLQGATVSSSSGARRCRVLCPALAASGFTIATNSSLAAAHCMQRQWDTALLFAFPLPLSMAATLMSISSGAATFSWRAAIAVVRARARPAPATHVRYEERQTLLPDVAACPPLQRLAAIFPPVSAFPELPRSTSSSLPQGNVDAAASMLYIARAPKYSGTHAVRPYPSASPLRMSSAAAPADAGSSCNLVSSRARSDLSAPRGRTNRALPSGRTGRSNCLKARASSKYSIKYTTCPGLPGFGVASVIHHGSYIGRDVRSRTVGTIAPRHEVV